MNTKLFIFFFLLILLGCKETTYKVELAKALQNVIGDTIELPSNFKFNKYNIESSKFDTYSMWSKKNNFKLITYAPDITCTPCLLSDLRPWYMLIDSIKQNLESKTTFDILFIFETDEYEELSSDIQEQEFSLPFCMDISKTYSKNNKFVKDFPLVTFLVDSSNVVKLLSAPLGSYKSRRILLEYIDKND